MRLVLAIVLVTVAVVVGLLTGYPILIGCGAVLAVLAVALVLRF
jgi:hypothetical protein